MLPMPTAFSKLFRGHQGAFSSVISSAVGSTLAGLVRRMLKVLDDVSKASVCIFILEGEGEGVNLLGNRILLVKLLS